jgi:hypothetical protein
MGNKNRKATKEEMAHARRVIKEAFPQYEPVFGGHGAYGGHRAPRDHTISFRLIDEKGKYHSNVIWLMPDALMKLTPKSVKWIVKRSQG